MAKFWKVLATSFFLLVSTNSALAALNASNVAGLYKAILKQDDTNFYQYALITLRTVNPSGQMQISANVRVFFGEANSNEYQTYEYDDVPLNLVTRQISLKNSGNDVSMVGFLREGQLEGEWYSSLVGKVGTFVASKQAFPNAEEGSVLVETLSGHYRGSLENENAEASLPGLLTFSFVTTQDNATPTQPKLVVSGNTRLYLGEFSSLEYVEIPFSDIQFNFFNRFLTAKTASPYGLTFKGTMNYDGSFSGQVYSDSLGRIGAVNLQKYPARSSFANH